MTILASLTNRIFLASATLAVVSIGAAVYFVSLATTRQAEAELQRGLIEAGTLVDQQVANVVENLTVMARLVADSPKLKAAVDTDDPPTVQPLARDYQNQLHTALLVLTGRTGNVLAEAGELGVTEGPIGGLPEIQHALAGREAGGFWPHSDGVLQVIAVPITIATPGLDRPDIVGSLAAGVRLDHNLAAQFKRATESDIAFAVDGRIRASTLPAADHAQLVTLLKADDVQTISLQNGEYVGLKRPLAAAASAGGAAASSVLLLRSRTERLRFLNAIHTGLGVVAMIAVLAATILSYAVARTITRPLATITDTMREMSATGDLTRKIALSRAASWDDEDAKLLATTFNTLTDSIARFQREAAQRERLSALGRLSTVIAHEIRNPLMIIKASLRTLANERVTRAEITQALTDVDEEVARLNRVVNDVLDFARPIRFEYAPADVNAVIADAEQATRTGHREMRVDIRTDPTLRAVTTDAERLRTALVNILANARHAVAARSASSPASAAESPAPSVPAVAQGTSSTAQGAPSVAEGTSSVAQGASSVAQAGASSVAQGASSVAQAGASSVAQAGASSVAQAGASSVAQGASSVAQAGASSVAQAGASSVAQGFSPVPDIEIEASGSGSTARIIVRDRGVGVKSEDLPRVFDPYFTTKRTGSGLGLAIAKNIVEGMGGSIALESRPGAGTEIRIDLPFHPEVST